MTTFIYENTEEILNENGHLLPSVIIEASNEQEADEIYRGYDGSRAQNKMRDYHF